MRARAAAAGARIVAVGFVLDGTPLGWDTTAPFSLGVDVSLLPSGRHRLRVVGVDSLGRRASSPPLQITTSEATAPMLTATPRRGLAKALAALRRGGVTVRLLRGRYRLAGMVVGTGARLLGSGRRTVIDAPPGESYDALVSARGSDIEISNLALNGGGPGAGNGYALEVAGGSRHVLLRRLWIRHVRRDGVYVSDDHSEVSVQESLIDGDGRAEAGVLVFGSDETRDASVIRSRIRGFREFGVNFVQTAFGRPAAASHALALDNRIEDITNPSTHNGTNEGGIWSGGVEAAIIGNSIRRTGWDGIETVGSSTRTTIVDNDVRSTRVGIYLERATNGSTISRNRLSHVETGINVEWRQEGIGSSGNTFSFNRVIGARRTGLFVDVGSDSNRILRNTFVGGSRPAIVLQGASKNLVLGNRACKSAFGSAPLVREQAASWDNGQPAYPQGNVLADNRNVRSCR
jgi:parallel beta-helix repeat protein